MAAVANGVRWFLSLLAADRSPDAPPAPRLAAHIIEVIVRRGTQAASQAAALLPQRGAGGDLQLQRDRRAHAGPSQGARAHAPSPRAAFRRIRAAVGRGVGARRRRRQRRAPHAPGHTAGRGRRPDRRGRGRPRRIDRQRRTELGPGALVRGPASRALRGLRLPQGRRAGPSRPSAPPAAWSASPPVWSRQWSRRRARSPCVARCGASADASHHHEVPPAPRPPVAQSPVL